MPKIVYLRDPKELICALGLGERADEFLQMITYFDYAGGVALPVSMFQEEARKLNPKQKNTLETLVNECEGKVHLRSRRYYIHPLEKNKERVRKLVRDYEQEISDNIDELGDIDAPEIERRLTISALLDHKKHYGLIMLNLFFGQLLKGEVNLEMYENVKGACIADVENYYKFLMTGKLGKQGVYSGETREKFSRVVLPSDTEPSLLNPEGEKATRKMIIREMDHPLQILLFAGQLLDQDKPGQIEVTVNPLSGAIEIGYALRSIYTELGIEKIKDVVLMKYSRYAEGDTERDIESCVPQALKGEIEKLRNHRIMIIDDNTFTGTTLKNLRDMMQRLTNDIGIAAIERISKIEGPRAIEYEELNIKPISKLRYVGNVMEFVKNNNLRGISQ